MRLRRTGLIGLSAVTVMTVLGVSAGSAIARPQPTSQSGQASNAKLHGWTKVSNSPGSQDSDIGLGRFGTDLQVVWKGTQGGNDTLNTAIVSSKGKLQSTAQQIADWTDINDFPQVIPYQGNRAILFSGLRSTDTTDPYASGVEYYETSSDGSNWTLADGQFSAGHFAYGSYGSDAVSADGDTIVVYTQETDNKVSYREGGAGGLDPNEPADPTTTPEPTGADVYDAGDGYNPILGDTWAVWWTLPSGQGTTGIQAQQIVPTLGPRVQAPQTATKSNGTYQSLEPNQRIDVAARPTMVDADSGLFAAYAVGYPSAKHVALWQLGASKALIFPAGGSVDLADAASGPDGRVWVEWYDSGTREIHAARTNPADTQLGATCTATTPLKSSSVWHLTGDGSEGPLQLFINAGASSATTIYSTTVKPCLSVHVSPSKVKPGHQVTVTVKDAGAPVQGAKVSVLGDHKTTGAKGTATFQVSRDESGGSHSVTVTADGYQKAERHLRVS